MKKVLPLLLALALLPGCGGSVQEVPQPGEVENVSLPEMGPAGSVSAQAIVTEGRAPTADYALPPSPADPRYSIQGWIKGGVAGLMAEHPEADAAFYAAPYQANEESAALIRWGSSLAEFDWAFLTPRTIPPRLDCFDADNDGEDELIVICYTGSGTGVSIEELHIIEKGPDETLTAYTLPETLWQERVPALYQTARIGDRTFAMLGYELVAVNDQLVDLETASAGLIAHFDSDGTTLSFGGAFCMSHEGSGAPCYVADTSADVYYQDGVFTLDNLHLYSYHQSQ